MSGDFPVEWGAFRDGVPPADREGDLVSAYSRLLAHPEAAVRENAARDWCAWEDVHTAVSSEHHHDPRYDDPRFRMAFARLVTHYWRHVAFLQDGELLRGATRLAGIPGVMVHGRRDLGAPLDIPWKLHRAWPDSELVVVDEAGHGTRNVAMQSAVVTALDRFAAH